MNKGVLPLSGSQRVAVLPSHVKLGEIHCHRNLPTPWQFTGIPPGFSALELIYFLRDPVDAASILYVFFNIRGTDFDFHVTQHTTAAAYQESNGDSYFRGGYVVGTSGQADVFTAGRIFIPGYADQHRGKTAICLSGVSEADNGFAIERAVGVWGADGAITGGHQPIHTIHLETSGGFFMAGSRATLYGIR